MKRLPPLLSYYGSKSAIAPLYPRPRYKQIVEPFAGGASYALCHADHDVLLVDKYDKLIAVWQYLIAASPAEVLSIPLLGHDETVDDLNVCQEARWLVGWWVQPAVAAPRRRFSTFAKSDHWSDMGFWSHALRQRIAATVPHIKHWRAVCADYTTLDVSQPATWFVDPPYQVAGKHYRHGSKAIDFAALGAWCRALPGQSIVCENEGADWLPFEPFFAAGSQTNKRKSIEVAWVNDGWRMPRSLSLELEASP